MGRGRGESAGAEELDVVAHGELGEVVFGGHSGGDAAAARAEGVEEERRGEERR
jgi:hypothetical protein